MKAAVLRGINRPFVIDDVPLPVLGPDEVLVQTKTCGICRTDLHIQDGLAYVPKLPHIPGHEPAGIVAEVGSAVRGIRIGERVVPHLFVRTAECRFTRAGQHAQATHLAGIIGVTLPGGFAEFFKAPAQNLLTLPENVPFDRGGLTSCAIITAVHACRKARLEAHDTAVVLGTGGIGQILIELLTAQGVRVLAVDSNEANLNRAIQAGAKLACLADDPTTHVQVRDFAAEREGVDCVFELVGRAETMAKAASYVRRCGQIVVIGEEAESPSIDSTQIAQRELTIVGSRNGGMQDARDALQLLAQDVIHPPIARSFPLDQINDALQWVRDGHAQGRVVITLGAELTTSA